MRIRLYLLFLSSVFASISEFGASLISIPVGPKSGASEQRTARLTGGSLQTGPVSRKAAKPQRRKDAKTQRRKDAKTQRRKERRESKALGLPRKALVLADAGDNCNSRKAFLGNPKAFGASGLYPIHPLHPCNHPFSLSLRLGVLSERNDRGRDRFC